MNDNMNDNMNDKMNDNDDYFKSQNQFNNDRKIFIEIPSSPPLQHPPKISSGFEPLESIHLEGETYRNLSRGHAPRWVMYSSWVVLGLPILFAFGIGLAATIELLKYYLIRGNIEEHLYEIFCMVVGVGGSLIFAVGIVYILTKGTRLKSGKPKRQ
ncbi:hypothetical protein ACL6C3_10060 [Capilliphycus salinus ALCB114379]|uniref:hypothetical protein n=1 Tax=Capilliphycus salinus TaxID=2768948 RepID=UPI0039A59D35